MYALVLFCADLCAHTHTHTPKVHVETRRKLNPFNFADRRIYVIILTELDEFWFVKTTEKLKIG